MARVSSALTNSAGTRVPVEIGPVGGHREVSWSSPTPARPAGQQARKSMLDLRGGGRLEQGTPVTCAPVGPVVPAPLVPV